ERLEGALGRGGAHVHLVDTSDWGSTPFQPASVHSSRHHDFEGPWKATGLKGSDLVLARTMRRR
ncbi:hypothetical protein ACLESO_60090, partial [Pyxidicoccus sp. 3LG]